MLHVLFTIILGLSLHFMRLSHPISMGVVLMFQTLVVGLTTGCLSDNFIYSYILFLVILGGVLVLFIYMTSLLSNEVFSFTWTDVLLALMVVGLIVVTVVTMLLPISSSMTMMEVTGSSSGLVFESLGLEKLYSSFTYLLTLFLVFYLLYVLLVCVSIVGNKSGALRKFS